MVRVPTDDFVGVTVTTPCWTAPRFDYNPGARRGPPWWPPPTTQWGSTTTVVTTGLVAPGPGGPHPQPQQERQMYFKICGPPPRATGPPGSREGELCQSSVGAVGGSPRIDRKGAAQLQCKRRATKEGDNPLALAIISSTLCEVQKKNEHIFMSFDSLDSSL